MKSRIFIPWIFIFAVIAVGCHQASTDEFRVAKPEEVGLNGQVLSELVDSIRSGFYPNRHSLLIYKDNRLVLEEYFTGRDESWGTDLGIVHYNDTLVHDMRSVSKSVVSACVGIAIAQGKIKSADQPVFDFFEDYGQYNSEGREELTIRHLLTMTSGLEWNEEVPYDNPENSEIQMIESGDGIGFVLSRKLVAKPGAVWRYNGGTTELLAEIVRRASGKNIHEFAQEFLFEPMGISRSEWTISPSTNTPAAASGLRLTSRDMIKFGILYLQKGVWEGQQVLPAEWVTESLHSHIERPEGGGYGYQFWVFNYSFQGQSLTIPTAVGNGDQRIFLDRHNKMVVAMTAGNYNKWDIKNNSSSILERIYVSLNPENR